MEGLVDARPLRRFCSIVSRRLLHAIDGGGRSLSLFDPIYPAFVGRVRNQIETELLADDASEKARPRVLLPFCRSHDSRNRWASGCPQHRDDAGVLGVGSRYWFGRRRRRSCARLALTHLSGG